MRKRKYCIIQFANCSYVVYKNDDGWHLFDPYGPPPPKSQNKEGAENDDEIPQLAAWMKFPRDRQLKRHIIKSMMPGAESFLFYTFDVLNVRKPEKKTLIGNRLAIYNIGKPGVQEAIGELEFTSISKIQL